MDDIDDRIKFTLKYKTHRNKLANDPPKPAVATVTATEPIGFSHVSADFNPTIGIRSEEVKDMENKNVNIEEKINDLEVVIAKMQQEISELSLKAQSQTPTPETTDPERELKVLADEGHEIFVGMNTENSVLGGTSSPPKDSTPKEPATIDLTPQSASEETFLDKVFETFT